MTSGAAPGADQLAVITALEAGGAVELYLPWRTYEQEFVETVVARFPGQVRLEVYYGNQNNAWGRSVQQYHPGWANLTQGAYALHARNYGIVHTPEGPVNEVYALPSKKRGGGGTGQGMRIAKATGVPLYDLTTGEGFALTKSWVLKKLNQRC